MIALESASRLEIDPVIFGQSFDREPFGFTHHLSELDLFEFGSLQTLAAKYRGEDYFVAAGGAVAWHRFLFGTV